MDFEWVGKVLLSFVDWNESQLHKAILTFHCTFHLNPRGLKQVNNHAQCGFQASQGRAKEKEGYRNNSFPALD